MSELSSIRSMRDLEYQRNRLQLKADKQERQLRRDIESIKADFAPIVNGVNSIRTGLSRLKVIAPFVMTVFRFFQNRRKNSKK